MAVDKARRAIQPRSDFQSRSLKKIHFSWAFIALDPVINGAEADLEPLCSAPSIATTGIESGDQVHLREISPMLEVPSGFGECRPVRVQAWDGRESSGVTSPSLARVTACPRTGAGQAGDWEMACRPCRRWFSERRFWAGWL